MFTYKRIFVAIDGSSESEYAFHKAISICKRNNSSLIAIHVLDKSYFMNVAELADPEVFRESSTFAAELIERYTQSAKKEGIVFDIKLKEGSPSSMLIKEFKALNEDDLVVCGSTTSSKIARLLFGSVAQSIVSEANSDVLIVRKR